MFEPVTLTTARLRVRGLRHSDAPTLFTIWSDAEAMRYFSFSPMHHVDEAFARVLERLGFVREGLLRERWIVGDEVTDSALYGLLRSDRRAQR